MLLGVVTHSFPPHYSANAAEKVINNAVEEDIKSMFDDLEEILDTESKKDE